MSQPFIGEIRMISFGVAPAGWLLCDGAMLKTNEHDELFNVIGTTYGGDGSRTFNLPDMRGRVPVHKGVDPDNIKYAVGQYGGSETVALAPTELAAHSHTAMATSAAGEQSTPFKNCVPALSGEDTIYKKATIVPIAMSAVTSVTGTSPTQGHENMMPYLCISYMISCKGVYPY